MKTTAPLLSCLLFAGVFGNAIAGTPINETRSVDARARIEVSNVRGAVNVSTWNRDEVEVTGTLGDGSGGLEIEGSGSRLSIRVRGAENRGWLSGWFGGGAGTRMEDTILDIKLPREAELDIGVVSATVAVSGLAGRRLEVNSVSGKVRVDCQAHEVEIGSVSGGITLAGRNGRVQAATVSGDIDAGTSAERFGLETVSGRINVETSGYRELEAGSVSGDINVRGTPAADARLESETMSGDVRVQLNEGFAGRIRAETFSGRLRSDFGTVTESGHGPGRSLDATIGEGAARLRIETFSGDIEIRGPIPSDVHGAGIPRRPWTAPQSSE
ncbi:DUF4097 family beta strand repeat-containing protein [Dokdonella sp.]|uniref:DUF4097 family beta strand repeat-containing protein n=1 Tax=Dokdonella sp. TaxID=2291710 RepID=UPI0025B9AA40|nr:DUF4097 family beta strand repeat-containing protein [Dokdonella sp.]MBX3690666.1 DUF4097 family beta strand repeat protein [Dokdonella sp.]MCW5569020.1 DUF4097 family beta strand repeat protein [Dokdonella sp.]